MGDIKAKKLCTQSNTPTESHKSSSETIPKQPSAQSPQPAPQPLPSEKSPQKQSQQTPLQTLQQTPQHEIPFSPTLLSHLPSCFPDQAL